MIEYEKNKKRLAALLRSPAMLGVVVRTGKAMQAGKEKFKK